MQTGHTLDDVGGSLSWRALGAFLRKIDPAGALAQELEPEIAAWAGTFRTNVILADIYDMLAQINANLITALSRRRAKAPPRYPRPGDDNKRRLGRDALEAEELDDWFENKRRQRKHAEEVD